MYYMYYTCTEFLIAQKVMCCICFHWSGFMYLLTTNVLKPSLSGVTDQVKVIYILTQILMRHLVPILKKKFLKIVPNPNQVIGYKQHQRI